MTRVAGAAVFLALFLPVCSLAARTGAAVDRGQLSLAWDAYESGLFEEALKYLGEIQGASPVAGEAVRLRAECLNELGRYPEAARLLNSKAAEGLKDREELLLDVYWGWLWKATSRGAYTEALETAQTALASFPENGYLAAFAAATRFRQELAQALEVKAEQTPAGAQASIRRKGASPPKAGEWEQVYPWNAQLRWVPRATLAEWMPDLAEKLGDEDKILWLKIGVRQFSRELEKEARRVGLELRATENGYRIRAHSGDVFVDRREWVYRAAAEGLGARGAALEAVEDARNALKARSDLSVWVQEHKGKLEIERIERPGDILRVRNAETRRSFDLDLAAWADLRSADFERWAEFWSDLNVELGRAARPFRCFCGREVQLRETLSAEPASSAALEKGDGFATAMIAICPYHEQRVTPELLATWGIGWPEAIDRARADSVKNTWDLVFERVEAPGGSYVVLEGEGVSALARRPELLLGALEAAGGSSMRGSSVRVVAPSPSSLVVSSGSAIAAEAGAAKVLLAAGRRGEKVNRVGYQTTVRLPMAGLGSFRLRPAE